MPPGYVNTIEEELFYEYAKLISRSALGAINHRFISDRFKALRDGRISMSNCLREWQKEQELPRECVFCGTRGNLQTDHLIPRSRGGDDSPENLVLACRSCNASRGDKGIFAWLGLKKKDDLHRLVAGKYLKELHRLHEKRGTLGIHKDSISLLCLECNNGLACTQWDKVGKLTCLCLESVF